jgi:drug/metabolite transporter (DMT)-like permease
VREEYKYQIWLHVAVFIFGTTGVLGKLISLGSHALVWYRLLIALVALALVFGIAKRRLAVDSRSALILLGVGLVLGVHWLTFFEAIKRSNVSVSMVCFSSVALFTSFIEPILFRRRILWSEPLIGVGIVVGLYLVFRFEFEFAAGMILSGISAALAALFTVLNGLLVRKLDPKVMTVYELLGAFFLVSACLGVLGLVEPQNMLPSLADLLWLAILGVVCTAFSFMLSVHLIRRITPYSFVMAINLEPIYAILLALVIWPESETMSSEFYNGAVFIVAMIFLNSYLKGKRGFAGKQSVDSIR